MKNLLLLSLVFVFLLPAQGSWAAITTVRPVEKEMTVRKMERAEKRRTKKEARAKKLMSKIKKKIDKKMKKKGITKTSSVLDNSKFRIGLILAGGSIALSILAAIIGGSGFLWAIASIAALGALVLIVWGLIEYTG